MRIRKKIKKAKVWVVAKDGKEVAGEVDLPEGWYAIAPPPVDEDRKVLITPTECPLLKAYAKREGVPEEELAKHGTDWPQFIYDMSVSHGPNLSKAEMAEFTAWKVK